MLVQNQVIKNKMNKINEQFSWFFSYLSVDRYKILPSGNLHIINIKQSDAGKYQCSAKNPLTGQIVNNSQITTLQILNKPSNSQDRIALTTVYKPPVASR